MAYNDNKKLEQYFKIVITEFENYKNNLLNKSMLIIFKNKQTNDYDYITIDFLGNNFYHLTGLTYLEDNGDKNNHFGSKFYNDLENKKLSTKKLKIKDDNTALKIKALPFISSGRGYIKMVGDFNGNGLKLQLDKVVGNPNICLGLKHIKDKTFAPASSLYTNTKEYGNNIGQVCAVYIKNINNIDKFEKMVYKSKNIDLEKILSNEKIKKIIK